MNLILACLLLTNLTHEFFTVGTKLAEMAILYSKDLTTAKKKLPPVGLDLVQEIIAGLGVQVPEPYELNWHMLFSRSLNFC